MINLRKKLKKNKNLKNNKKIIRKGFIIIPFFDN